MSASDLAATMTMLPSEAFLALSFPDFEGGFTPWENHDPFSFVQTHHQSPSPVNSNSGSDEPQSMPPVSAVDERKQRRMISNRESARRSRKRKQQHLENLRNQVNRLRIENREIINRLGFVTHHCHLLRRDNDQLRSESFALRQRLSDIRPILVLRQFQHHPFLPSSSLCNSFSSVNEVNEQPQLPSLIV
ncbi:basic leucine zipper 4-like [Macadamia integrifolia]|uniref:basic leucine zipper 4-like n=1 Tax=Macadamia integrifolia TaxID=60698 RepID=UPI001C4FE3DA|nr:basic leucine zipper 4-like [Macadamia integrifolia]